MNQVLNISGYKFVALAQLEVLQAELLASAAQRGLRGTILLAQEGINLFLAGAADDVESFLRHLRTVPALTDFHPTPTWSVAQPFRKLLVKVKNEIIRMNRPSIRPALERAPVIGAETARRWMNQGHDDEDRALVMLDTRNGFEVDHGSFEHAVDWRLGKFSDFPQAFEAHRGELEGKTVLSFCTGGIRCEKAALHMRESGLPNVWQLDGGILKYLEQTDGAHFHGNCFVFDQREALDPKLGAIR